MGRKLNIHKSYDKLALAYTTGKNPSLTALLARLWVNHYLHTLLWECRRGTTFREGILVISIQIINILCDLTVPLLENYPTDI